MPTDEFRKSVLNRLPPIPPTRAPWAHGVGTEDDEEEEEDLRNLADALPSGPSSSRARADLSPLSAAGFFDQALEVAPPGNDTTFRAYMSHPSTPSSSKKPTYLVCHHGAGAGGLGFAALAKEVTQQGGRDLGVLSFDARGHGKTKSPGKKEDTDLALEMLLADFIGILEHLFPDVQTAPSLLLLGHSMGAAPVLAAAPLLQKKGYTVPGVIVLDVVEGTAVESLPLMKGILSKRPKTFRSVSDAIQWHLASGSIRNETSARVSVPSYVVPAPDVTDPGPESKQVWRTDLLATEPYWQEWWNGLSQKFLSSKCARLLVLAGKERLDKDLMVGQMQGKFQLEVMRDVGHYLHEFLLSKGLDPKISLHTLDSAWLFLDDPSGLATMILAFWRRNTQVLVLPPKVGERPGDRRGSIEVRPVGQT